MATQSTNGSSSFRAVRVSLLRGTDDPFGRPHPARGLSLSKQLPPYGRLSCEFPKKCGHAATLPLFGLPISCPCIREPRRLAASASRLPGCPEKLLEAELGLLLDAGFVAARGGVEPALVTAATAISRTNAIYEDQARAAA